MKLTRIGTNPAEDGFSDTSGGEPGVRRGGAGGEDDDDNAREAAATRPTALLNSGSDVCTFKSATPMIVI